MVYAVIGLGDNDRLQSLLRASGATIYDETGPSLYLVDFHGTGAELNSLLRLGDADGGGDGVVLQPSTHIYGYTYASFWEWLEKNR